MFKNEYIGPKQTPFKKSKLAATLTLNFYAHYKAPNYEFKPY